MSTGQATTVVDDNSEVTTALQTALAADENAIAVAEQTGAAIKDANNAISTAQGRLADANEAAETAWDEAYDKLKARAKRSPVGAGPFGAMTVAIVALGLALFAGCGPSSKQVSDLSTRFTVYEDVMGDVFRASREESAELAKVLAAHSAAIDRQTAAITAALQKREVCDCFPPPPCPCDESRPAVEPPLILPLPESPPRNPASESDSPAPAELVPAPKPKCKPKR